MKKYMACMLVGTMLLSGCASVLKVRENVDEYGNRAKNVAQKGIDILGDAVKKVIDVGIVLFGGGKNIVDILLKGTLNQNESDESK